MAMKRILAINGSYRDDGITDQLVHAVSHAATVAGGHVELVQLRDYPIEFCLNCRECTQQHGTAPGKCVHDDAMQALIDRIESADAYILASPTNFGSVTALFKRFMERLLPYVYWPWGADIPKFRKGKTTEKKAVTISSSAAPSLIGKWLFGTRRQLRMAAKTIGARSVADLFVGSISTESNQQVSDKMKNKAQAAARKLIRG
jgi:multimeric flavodoxin WrbA